MKFLADKTVLQFSPDPSVEGKWFKSYEVSVYEGDNSLDVQNIKRSDGSYNIVICTHVLEHVPEDKKALGEILRVSGMNGFVLLAIPAPYHREKTVDWGYPKQEEHGHFRVYGRDIVDVLLNKVLNKDSYIPVIIEDTATNSKDCIYILSKNKAVLKFIQELMERIYP